MFNHNFYDMKRNFFMQMISNNHDLSDPLKYALIEENITEDGYVMGCSYETIGEKLEELGAVFNADDVPECFFEDFMDDTYYIEMLFKIPSLEYYMNHTKLNTIGEEMTHIVDCENGSFIEMFPLKVSNITDDSSFEKGTREFAKSTNSFAIGCSVNSQITIQDLLDFYDLVEIFIEKIKNITKQNGGKAA